MAEGTGLPPALLKYWLTGPGAGRIVWNSPGDFMRCVTNIQEEASKHGKPLADNVVKGLCATLHKMATGGSPGHGSAE